jgi:2-oxoglutarate ferredoxin oxidoreductase subunit alpha
LRYLNPLPNDLESIIKAYNKVLVAELNSGHLCQIIRATYLVDAQLISQSNGQPFTVSQVIDYIKAEANHEQL